MNTEPIILANPTPSKVYLVDGSGYIFRAFHAVAPLTTADGFPTNALFGFARMFVKLLSQLDSQYIAVVFDAGQKTFRNEIYPEYKANRSECPEELRMQMPFFRQIVSALGLKQYELPGFEADDLIATLTARLVADQHQVVVISGDKDLMQLVGPQVSIWDTMRDQRFGSEQVKTRFGVQPNQVIELLALTGDSSDNIPGIDGVGPKTAAQLIEKYGDVEAILAAWRQIAEDSSIRNRKKIAQQLELKPEALRLSRKLVGLDSSVPLILDCGAAKAEKLTQDAMEGVALQGADCQLLLAGLMRANPRKDLLRELTAKLEFSSIFDSVIAGLSGVEDALLQVGKSVTYTTIYQNDFEHWLEKFNQVDQFAFDTETTSLRINEADLVGVSLCWSEDEAYYIPVGHRTSDRAQVSLERLVAGLSARFANSSVRKLGQNIKYDIGVLQRCGLQVAGAYFDTMLAAYVGNPDRSTNNLSALSLDFLGRGLIEFEEVVGDAPDFSFADVERATRYACQDAHIVWLLHAKLAKLLEPGELSKVFSEIEMPLVPVLAQLELRGIKLDVELLAKLSVELAESLVILEKDIYQIAGTNFNLNSPKQLAEVLFERLKINTKGVKKTKTGFSTDSSVLEKLRNQHSIAEKLLNYRSLYKLKSTYVDVLPAQVCARTSRLHTTFNQAVAGTGRLSSSDPNLQNIPIQTVEGRRIRAAFIAEGSNVLISADYSQIELRVLAHMSGDSTLIDTFKREEDIHARTTQELLGISQADMTPEMRRVGKTLNFGILYGMGAFRLSQELGIPLSEAASYIERYFERYPGVRYFFDSLEKQAITEGFVSTLFGRRRILHGLDARGRDQGFVRRVAINAPIQGTSADLIKLAMIRVNGLLDTQIPDCRMLLQIHDELLFECPQELADKAAKLIIEVMEQVHPMLVPLKVQAGIGKNWQQAHA